MQEPGARSCGYSFVALLKDCAKRKDLKQGSKLHSEILNKGLLSKNIFIGSTLVAMYVRCGDLAKAHEVFDQLPMRNVVSWNALMSGYMNQGHNEKVLFLLENIELDGVCPSCVTFICSLKACTSMDAIDKGSELHAEIARRGLLLESSNLCCAVVDMYVHFSLLARGWEVLQQNCGCSVDAWNAMISGYVKHLCSDQALHCFNEMQLKGILPDAITFSCILNGCANAQATEVGMSLHMEITKNGLLERDMILGSSLLDMYSKCGFLEDALKVFNQLAVKDTVAWTSLIKGHVDHDHALEALEYFRQVQFDGLSMDSIAYLHGLKACGSIRATADGRLLHADVEKRGFCNDVNLCCALIDMYCKCGLFAEANQVFSSTTKHDIILWNALISGHVDNGLSEEALGWFDGMQSAAVFPDEVTLSCCLKACGNIGSIERGRQMHADILCKGQLEDNAFVSVGNALIDMYGKCGSAQEAHKVLKILPFRDNVSWNSLISAHAFHKHMDIADECFKQMQLEGFCPSFITFSTILKACSTGKAVEWGMEVHAELVSRGLVEGPHCFLGEMVVDLYANGGFLKEAKNVFEKLPVQSGTAWGTLLSAYLEQGLENDAIKFLNQIQHMGTLRDHSLLMQSLKTYGIVGAVDSGLDLHAEIERSFSEMDFIGKELIDMYMRLSLLTKAQEVFDRLLAPEVNAWNSLIDGLTKHGLGALGLSCFQQMQLEGALPDGHTFIGILNACCGIRAIAKGRELHAVVATEICLEQDVMIVTTLVHMYVKCGCLEEAHGLLKSLSFQSALPWNILIAGYTKVKCSEQAVACYKQMLEEGILPDMVTFLCTLKACSSGDTLLEGRDIHADVVRKGLICKDPTIGNALIYMYVSHGYLAEAQIVFQKLPSRDVVSWNTLMTGFLLCDQGDKAINFYKQMQFEGVSFDSVTILCVLKACGGNGAFGIGQEVHAEIERDGLFTNDANVVNSLISMYVRCGSVFKAVEVFNRLEKRDLISWNTFIMGTALHGDSMRSLEILKGMEEEGIRPDSTTFLGVLYACNHEGIVDRMELYFYIICNEQKNLATIENLTCVVDLLGRAGQLDRAATIIQEMPFHPDIVMSCSLLGACLKWGIVELASRAFKHAMLFDERDSAAHFYMLNLYTGAEMDDTIPL